MNTRTSAVHGALLLSVCSLMAACGGGAPERSATANAPVVDTATFTAEAIAIAGLTLDSAVVRPFESTVTVPGRLMLDPEALETIGAIAEGRITHVPVQVGDRVAAGQALVMIHSHEIMEARNALVRAGVHISAAEAERDFAITAAERAHRLLDAKAMSRADVERADVARRVAQAEYEEAVAERDRARALIEHLAGLGPLPPDADEHDVIVRTPIAGVVTTRLAQPGAVVLPGTPLVSVGAPQRLLIQLRIPLASASDIAVGSTVRYALTDAAASSAEARVTRIAPTVDTLTRTIEVLAQPRGAVIGRAEAYVQATIRSSASTQALMVPSAAVQSIEGDTVVIGAEAHGASLLLRAKPVRTGRRTAEWIEILSGVTARERVVVQGAAIAKAELLKRRSGGAIEE